jgi:hypothetical protein
VAAAAGLSLGAFLSGVLIAAVIVGGSVALYRHFHRRAPTPSVILIPPTDSGNPSPADTIESPQPLAIDGTYAVHLGAASGQGCSANLSATTFLVGHRDRAISITVSGATQTLTLTGTLNPDYTFEADATSQTEGVPFQVSISGAFAQGSNGVIVKSATLQEVAGPGACTSSLTAQHQ